MFAPEHQHHLAEQQGRQQHQHHLRVHRLVTLVLLVHPNVLDSRESGRHVRALRIQQYQQIRTTRYLSMKCHDLSENVMGAMLLQYFLEKNLSHPK